MRIVLIACLAASALLLRGPAGAMASADSPLAWPAAAAPQAQEVDDNDDTRVEVQLVVLGIVIGTVFVAGSGAYLLRKRLGLVAPPPEQDAGGHH
jgi:hypothetical protein